MSGRAARHRFILAVVLLLGLGCTSPVEQPTPSPSPSSGGTLRIGITGDDAFVVAQEVFADPALQTKGYLLRCCLTRTLLTYPGEATTDGGTVLQPDLAERMPEVSRDGLTWTFRLRHGIRYAPPHQDIEVTSADFVFAVERALRLLGGEVIAPFSFVAGVEEYARGEATSISGLETPDAHTLIVRLLRPYGAFDWVADPAWAPIPAAVANGHDADLRVYWPSIGPYMFDAYPADASANSAVLIRNPSWSAATDPRRGAYVDSLVISYAGGDRLAALANVDAGVLDFVDFPVPAEQASAYRANPATSARLRTTIGENAFRLPMNLAVPPFDDVAVRRAVNFAVDRRALSDALALQRSADVGVAQPPTSLSEHVFPDSISAGLLVGYDPFSVGTGEADPIRARSEMSASRYDTDRDGVCDSDVCAAIRMPAFDMAAAEAVRESLAVIGVMVEPVPAIRDTGIELATNRIGIELIPYGWFFELTGSELAVLVRGGARIASEDGFVANTSLVGALPEDLNSWGYSVTTVPSVDDVIDRCEREVGHRRAACWAELDQLVAENIVPWVPLFSFESPWLASPRVAHFSLDQSLPDQFPALDRVSLVPGL